MMRLSPSPDDAHKEPGGVHSGPPLPGSGEGGGSGGPAGASGPGGGEAGAGEGAEQDLLNVFVIGLDEINARHLHSVADAYRCRFLPLLERSEVRGLDTFDFDGLLEEARNRLRSSGSSVDAVCSYWDFPVMEMVAVLAAEAGVQAPPLATIVRCHHGYWSRLIQRSAAPDVVPDFVAVDPREDAPDIPFDPPYWLKPVRSHNSHLAFRVGDSDELPGVLSKIRAEIPRLAEAYAPVLDRVDLPDDVSRIDGGWCVAEQEMQGRQCTLEGYVWQGAVVVYGIVDTIRVTGRSDIARYEYPSTLPSPVRSRMVKATEQVIRAMEYDNAPFNAEFFWDAERDEIWLLEVNARQSQSHAGLFEQVDGRSNHEAMVALALGHSPHMVEESAGGGEFEVAAQCFLRHDQDGIVQRAPSSAEVREVEARHPGTEIRLLVSEGQHLDDLADQASYSYELATVLIGAADRHALLDTLRSVEDELALSVAPTDRTADG
jgi:hypothetical protein